MIDSRGGDCFGRRCARRGQYNSRHPIPSAAALAKPTISNSKSASVFPSKGIRRPHHLVKDAVTRLVGAILLEESGERGGAASPPDDAGNLRTIGAAVGSSCPPQRPPKTVQSPWRARHQ